MSSLVLDLISYICIGLFFLLWTVHDSKYTLIRRAYHNVGKSDNDELRLTKDVIHLIYDLSFEAKLIKFAMIGLVGLAYYLQSGDIRIPTMFTILWVSLFDQLHSYFANGYFLSLTQWWKNSILIRAYQYVQRRYS